MTVISATLVKELREMTGAGIMDAKRALQETGGDIDAAQRVLREKGMASAAKRAGRATTEGKSGSGSPRTDIAARSSASAARPAVSNNDEFLAFAKKVLMAIDEQGVGAEQQLDEERAALSAKLGENITIVSPARFERLDGGGISGYAHPPANKLGVLVQTRGGVTSSAASWRRGVRAAVDLPRGRAGGHCRRRARHLPQLRRGPVEARAGA